MKGAAVEAGTENELARHGRNGPAAAELISVPFLEECKAPTFTALITAKFDSAASHHPSLRSRTDLELPQSRCCYCMRTQNLMGLNQLSRIVTSYTSAARVRPRAKLTYILFMRVRRDASQCFDTTCTDRLKAHQLVY